MSAVMYYTTSDWCVAVDLNIALAYQCNLRWHLCWFGLDTSALYLSCSDSWVYEMPKNASCRCITSGFTEASHSKVVPPQTLQLHTNIMLQPSSLWRWMLRYRSMSHIKKPLIMHVGYRQALRRRCCAWSWSMAALLRDAMLLMSPASSSLIIWVV